MNLSGMDSQQPTEERRRDGARVAQALRDSIVRLDLRPGVALDEAEVATRLAVSRTPVREAIIELIAEGLVVREGRKARVAPLDLDDVPRLYDALLISSRLVQRLAAVNRSADDLARIEAYMRDFEASVASGNGLGRSQANQRMHMAISRAAGNRYISAFYEHVLTSTIRLSRACFTDARAFRDGHDTGALAHHLKTTMDQHRAILAAIADRDGDRADRLAVDHYILAKNRIVRVLFDGSAALRAVGDIGPDDIGPDSWPPGQ